MSLFQHADYQEFQLTSGNQGHFLHSGQVFSADGQWLVYDTRNDDTHVSRTASIERLHIPDGNRQILYQTTRQSLYGPGVGVASYHPVAGKVLFMHGLRNCDKGYPYRFTRRTGAMVEVDFPNKPIFLDARDIVYPYTPGALRGGSHAHQWSPDGKWISFTYNDAVVADLQKNSNGQVSDLRTVGVMSPVRKVYVASSDNADNFNGEMFSAIVSDVCQKPRAGSDEINRAYKECWIGDVGFLFADKPATGRELAFLGDVCGDDGTFFAEVFVVKLPEDITRAQPGLPLSGTRRMRPQPPVGVSQRRITYTQHRKFKGVQQAFGILSSPTGSEIYVVMKDNRGIDQIYAVGMKNEGIRQITQNESSVDTNLALSPDGHALAYGIEQSIYITLVSSGLTRCLWRQEEASLTDLRGINWSPDGRFLVYNRKAKGATSHFYQIFALRPVQ